MKQVPITEARADLANLVNEVVYRGERIALTRHGKPLAVLISVDEAEMLTTSEGTQQEMQVLDISRGTHDLGIAAHYDGPR